MEERGVLGEMFGGLEVFRHDQPDGRRMGARELGDDGAAGGRADTSELVAVERREDRHAENGN